MNNHLYVVDGKAGGKCREVLPSPVQMLRNRTEQFMAARLHTVFDHVDDAFFDFADNSADDQNQDGYFDAMRLIRMKRKSVEAEFLSTVRDSFCNPGLFESVNNSDDSLQEDSNKLKLLDNDELEESIAFEGMVSRADEYCKKPLQNLSARLATQYSGSVTPANNPVGPSVMCNAFRHATETLEIGIRAKLILLKLFERHALSVLGDYLHESNQFLEKLGVVPAKKSDADAHRKSSAKTTTKKSSEAELSFDIDIDDFQKYHDKNYQPGYTGSSWGEGKLVAQLCSVLSQDQFDLPDDGVSYVAPDDLLKALGAVQLQSPGSEDNRGDWLAAAIKKHLATQGGPTEFGIPERSVFTLVNSLFSHARNDRQISSLLASEMRDLELAIAKIALKDPCFFDRENHPVRKLLNELEQVTIGYGSTEPPTDDPICKKIQEVVEQLKKANVDEEELTRLLTSFTEFIEKDRRRSRAIETRLLEEVDGRERLNNSHTAVKAELEQLLIGRALPKIVLSFVEQGWAKVLFLIHLREGKPSSAWTESLKMLSDIVDIWGQKDRAPTAKQVGELFEHIRFELEKTALDPYQVDHLMRGLQIMVRGRTSANPSVIDRFELDLIHVSALRLNIPGQPCETASSSGQQSVDDACLKRVDAMKRGDWVEFVNSEGIGRRARFAGAVGPRGTLVFVNRKGAKVAEGARHRVALELKRKRLVLLGNSPLFERAMKNTVRDVESKRNAA